MSTSDTIALITLIFTIITTLCALFLAFAALIHSARPRISVKLLKPSSLICSEETDFIFEFRNRGHWYASPTVVDMTVFTNFDPVFDLHEIRFGSIQESIDRNIKIGAGSMKYLKATGIKLGYREPGEQVHVHVTSPEKPGNYQVRITAYSANGANLTKEFKVPCRSIDSSN